MVERETVMVVRDKQGIHITLYSPSKPRDHTLLRVTMLLFYSRTVVTR